LPALLDEISDTLPTHCPARLSGIVAQTAPVDLTHLERMVWISDWPHPTEKTDTKPDDTILFDLLADWAPDEATRSRILVDNPAALCRFD
jgi:predicted TIM-barrel fold metal-dependent hydrolase